jgi:hypothetical protein
MFESVEVTVLLHMVGIGHSTHEIDLNFRICLKKSISMKVDYKSVMGSVQFSQSLSYILIDCLRRSFLTLSRQPWRMVKDFACLISPFRIWVLSGIEPPWPPRCFTNEQPGLKWVILSYHILPHIMPGAIWLLRSHMDPEA